MGVIECREMSALDVLSEYIASAESQRLTAALEYAFRSADSQLAQSLVSQLKQTIKQRRVKPSCKLRALQALTLGLATENPQIRSQVARKMLSRLMKIAKSKSSLRPEVRGAVLFGEQSDPTERQASSEFLTTLLNCFKSWAEQYSQMQDGAAFSRVYHMLLRDKVQFPREIRPQTQLCLYAAQMLERLLAETLPNPAELERTVEVLNQQAVCIEQIMKEGKGSSSEVKKYIEEGSLVKKALQMYQSWLRRTPFHPVPKASDVKVPISKIPAVLNHLKPIPEPCSLPEPSNLSDSSQEIGFFFDFDSDIHQEAQSSHVDFQWDEPDTSDLKAEWQAAKSQVAYLEEKIGDYRACLSSQEKLIGRKVEDIAHAQRKIAAVEDEKAAVLRQLTDFQTQLVASEKELQVCREAVKAKSQEDSKQAIALESRIRQAKADLAQSQLQLDALNRDQAELIAQTSASGPLATELAAKEEEVKQLEERWAKLQAVSKELAEVKEDTARRERERKAKEAAASEGQKLTYEIQQLAAELQAAESQAAALEADIRATQAQVSEQECVVQQTLRESQEALANLHHSRSESAKRAVEDIASHLSISSHNAVPARSESDSSDRLNQSLNPLSKPIYPKVAPPEDDEEIEAEDDEISPIVMNWREYCKGFWQAQGLLYAGELIQVGFDRAEGKLTLAVCNVGQQTLSRLTLDFVDCPVGTVYLGLEVTPVGQDLSSVLHPAAQTSKSFKLTCFKPFSLSPKLNIAYSLDSSRIKLVLAVPLGILHFCEPFQSQTESLEQQWRDLAPFQSQHTLQLPAFLHSLRSLAGLLATTGNFLVCAPNEANWLQAGEFLATGRALDREIMLQITVKPGRKCILVLRSVPIRLRECVLAHLTCILSPLSAGMTSNW